MYADVGPLSNNQSRSLGNSLDFDEHRVEYAQLNHKAQVSIPTATTEKSTNEGTVNADIAMILATSSISIDHGYNIM